jgi:hypothetical protein
MTTTPFDPLAEIQTYMITNSGTYALTLDGAQGGNVAGGGAGGLGAAVSGDIYLTAGTMLEIVVGGEGGAGEHYNYAAGGGGGSFVFEGSDPTDLLNDVLLAAAGGGGGGGSQGTGGGGGTSGSSGIPVSGQQLPGQGQGGADGAAGTGGTSNGGGGGGYTGGSGGGFGDGETLGTSFSGGAGAGGGDGGFGGGGGGALGGGGGGGYGGGGGGYSTGYGGGAGSYDADLTGAMAQGATHSGDGFVSLTEVSCFFQGTRIATPEGERAVETLAKGDLVTTADGRSAPVRWIGRRTLRADGENGYRFADPLVYLPIRIRAGALGDNLPASDLLVSMDHAILIEDLLVQAGALVNGRSVIRETRLPETFTYYHIELADHALVLAEGVPAETFVDNVARMGFDNWAEHEALYEDEPIIPEMPYPRVQSHRQLPQEIREAIDARARTRAAAGRGQLAA